MQYCLIEDKGGGEGLTNGPCGTENRRTSGIWENKHRNGNEGKFHNGYKAYKDPEGLRKRT